jgi:L-glyceraldehyde 3-phosphate reductase
MSKGKSLKESILTPELLQYLNHLNDEATANGQTLAEKALRWILDQKGVTSVLIGASSVAQLEKNLKCIE